MKKRLIVAFLSALVLGSFSLMAQSGGIKVGVHFANMSVKPSSAADLIKNQRSLISPRFGFIYEMPVYQGVFFQTGINVSAKGYKFDSNRTIDGKKFDSQEYNLISYVDLPLQFGYKFDVGVVKLFGMTGPVFNYAVYTTNLYKADGEYDNDHQSVGTSTGDNFKPFDFNWNIEGGLQYSHFQFSLFYSYGFSNVQNKPDQPAFNDLSMKNSLFGLNIAILFGNIEGRKR